MAVKTAPRAPTEAPVSWQQLLVDAVQQPGTISTAYSAFWNYSLGNQLLALWQCQDRGLQPGPIGAAGHWRGVGRWICKGQRALTLCMPIVYDGWAHGYDKDSQPYAAEHRFVRFVYKARWFVLAQTDGEPYTPPPIPAWDAGRALAALDITEAPFTELNGNALGYAEERTIHISPLSPWPPKTRFHEMAHVLLGHTTPEGLASIGKAECEVEAEAVAYLCGHSLGVTEGTDEARGYIQFYLKRTGRDSITEAVARRIFAACERIIRAGRPPKARHEDTD